MSKTQINNKRKVSFSHEDLIHEYEKENSYIVELENDTDYEEENEDPHKV